MQKSISIIGTGFIGSGLADYLLSNREQFQLDGVFSNSSSNELKTKLAFNNSKVFSSVEELIESKSEIIVEAAHPNVVKQYGAKILYNSSLLQLEQCLKFK